MRKRMIKRGAVAAMAALFAAGAVMAAFTAGAAVLPPPPTAPEALPPVTVRWEDPAQSEVFIVEGAHYQCRVGTNPARLLSLSVDGSNVLGDSGAELSVSDAQGNRYRPAPREAKPKWKIWRRAWVPAPNARARMNVWSAGPYYWDAHLLDIPLVRDNPAADPSAPPLRGEVIFHAHPDQLRIEIRVNDNGNNGGDAPPPALATAAHLTFPGGKVVYAGTQKARPLGSLGNGAAGMLCSPNAVFSPDFRDWSAPLGAGNSAVWVIRPVSRLENGMPLVFARELNPLPDSAVTVTNGTWRGYDAASGLYRVDAAVPNPSAFGFEESYRNPNRRLTVGLHFNGAAAKAEALQARQIVVKCHTTIGNLEAAVLTDGRGFPLPTVTQVSKNFNGEREEPDDSAYGDSYFPLSLTPGGDTEVQVVHANQNWGTHPLKQVSSLRFFNIYWHLSTGSSETTCFTHNWMQIGRSGFLTIPDFRPRSGPFWAGQPQHDCLQWPGFLQYASGGGGGDAASAAASREPARLVYERTVFESVSPNLARFTLHYHTSDDAAKARISVMEIPQSDEARTFLHLRYDWQKPAAITGDARINFRLFNLFEKRTPQNLYFTPPDGGATRTVAVRRDDTPLLTGEPLSADSPFAATLAAPFTGTPQGDSNQPEYHSIVLVRSFRAQLGGKVYDRAALSAQFGVKDGSYWLTVPDAHLSLLPGDFVEADLMLMPHSGTASGPQKAEQERGERFGAGIPTLTAHIGTKIADFPATVRARDDAAEVTVSGGFDQMPLIVEGFGGNGFPLVWQGTVWQNPQANNGDGCQVEGDGKGGYRFVTLYPIRRGQQPRLTITRAACTTGFSRVYENNGAAVVLEATAPGGVITLKAPVLFGPGKNIVSAASPLWAFTGSASTVRSLPVTVDFGVGGSREASITLDATGRKAHLSRKAGAPNIALTFGGLAPGAVYTVTVTGMSPPARQTAAAADGTLRVVAAGGEIGIMIAPGRTD